MTSVGNKYRHCVQLRAFRKAQWHSLTDNMFLTSCRIFALTTLQMVFRQRIGILYNKLLNMKYTEQPAGASKALNCFFEETQEVCVPVMQVS